MQTAIQRTTNLRTSQIRILSLFEIVISNVLDVVDTMMIAIERSSLNVQVNSGRQRWLKLVLEYHTPLDVLRLLVPGGNCDCC